MPIPVVSKVSPNTAPCTGGTLVTIRGRGFVNVTEVTFGGVATKEYRVDSRSRITVVSPPRAAGAAGVQVVTNSGTSDVDAAQLTYVEVNGAIRNGAPPAGTDSKGGTRLLVRFATQITALVPMSTSGVVEILVSEATASSPVELLRALLAKPVVISVSPNCGTVHGGTPVTISGSGFTGATGVQFGSASVEIPANTSDTTINVNSPAAASTGTVDVIVGLPSGVHSDPCAGDKYTYT